MWDLIASVPGHCLSFYSSLIYTRQRCKVSPDFPVILAFILLVIGLPKIKSRNLNAVRRCCK